MIEPEGILEFQQPASMSWSLDGVRLSSRVTAAGRALRGGDWCEAFSAGTGVIALSIGDVCGHGEGKYAAMTAVRRAIRDAAARGLDPARTLADAHEFLRGYDPEGYATALFGLLDLRTQTLVFANAGHPAPLMAGPSGTEFLEFPDADLPLGIEAHYLPVLRTVNVAGASLLVFYTDGVTEHERKPLEGAVQLLDAAIFASKFSSLPAAAVIEKQMFLTGSNFDDAAILAAWLPAAPGPVRSVTKVFGRSF